jgi:hypothetical protein
MAERYTKQDCIDGLKEAADILNKSPTRAEYEELNVSPSPEPMRNLFGSWSAAKEAAGLQPRGQTVSSKCPDIYDMTQEEWENLSNAGRHSKTERAHWAEVKVSTGCERCGYDTHHKALDFHHKEPENKVMAVSKMICRNWKRERVAKEVAKCEVLCANCHRIL